MRHAYLCRILIVVVGLVLTPPMIRAQQPSVIESRRAEVIRALTSIRSLLGDGISGPAREAVGSILALAAKPILSGRGGEVPIPVATVTSFQQDEIALRRRNDAFVKALEVTRAVETDLTTKDAAYKSSPMGLATLITIEVRTKLSSGVEANGWQVMVVSAPLASFPKAPGEAFGAFSSPTSRPLAPGPYVIWATDPADAAVQGPKKPITLGSVVGGTVSLAPVSIDILVPKSLR